MPLPLPSEPPLAANLWHPAVLDQGLTPFPRSPCRGGQPEALPRGPLVPLLGLLPLACLHSPGQWGRRRRGAAGGQCAGGGGPEGLACSVQERVPGGQCVQGGPGDLVRLVAHMHNQILVPCRRSIRLINTQRCTAPPNLLQDHIASSQASAGFSADGQPPPACFLPGWQCRHPPHRMRARMQVSAGLSAGAAGSAAEMLVMEARGGGGGGGRDGTTPAVIGGGARTLPPAALAVVAELALEGDGGFWLSHIITPVFLLLAQEVWTPSVLTRVCERSQLCPPRVCSGSISTKRIVGVGGGVGRVGRMDSIGHNLLWRC